MKKNFLFIAGIIFLSFYGIYAQEYNREDPIPVDPNVKIGKLNNGLTYYIRNNEMPEDRAEFYLVVNAGAILEDDDQDGLAHFCEHMAFNGTKHFEKHEIINYLQSIGMKFGPEINAFTSHDVTNYMLQKVPTDEPANIDTSLLILYDWASNVSFEEEEIDKERGVIHEEWRTRRGAQFRMSTKYDTVLYHGSKYAKRDVIGDIDIIDNCEYDALRRFYQDWYRPDLQAIIAVGDFDVDVIEQKIVDLFSKIPTRENPKERLIYEMPDHEETLIAIESDKEAQYSIVQIYYKHDTEESEVVSDYRREMMYRLYNQMMNTRLNELLQEENPPFIYGYSAYTNMVRSKDAYVAFALAKNNEIDRTLETILTENKRIKQHGFVQTELERNKEELLSDLEKQYKERNKQKSASYVWAYFSHFLEEEPIPGIEWEYEFAQRIIPGITLDEINSLAKNWITDENRVVIITGPEKEGVEIPGKPSVREIVNKVESAEVEPYVDNVSDQPLLAEEPTPGQVVDESSDDKFGTVNWTLKNGIEVTIKPTDFKDDEILMRAYSEGGTSLYDLDDLPTAEMADQIVMESGLGSFDKIALEKYLAGKNVALTPWISELQEGFQGNSSPKDLETLLQMTHLYFTQPRKDEKAFNAYITRMKGVLENRSLNPSTTLWDSAMVIVADHHPRVKPMTSERLDKVKFNKLHYIFTERFGDPSGFKFYFVGNIDPAEARPLIEKYLGGLPMVNRQESWKDNGVRKPNENINRIINRKMEVPKSTVYISFPGEFEYTPQNKLLVDAINDILDVRYTETIREEQGGTYGVGVFTRFEHYPVSSYQLTTYFDCDPENADRLKQIIYEEIEKLKTEGPEAKDLKGVKENKIKAYKENLKENRFWANTLKDIDYHKFDPSVVESYADMVEGLTADDIKEAANKYFAGNHVEIIMMPENLDENLKNPVMEKGNE